MATQADTASSTSTGQQIPPPAPQPRAGSTPPEPQHATPPTDAASNAPADDVVPKSEVARAIEKARREEKEKLYPEIERLKAARAEGEAKAAELEQQLEAQRLEVEGLRTGKVEETESINKELRELRKKNQKLETAIENVATEAAAKLRASELAAYREKQIRASGIQQLAELVGGDSEEAIDAAIKRAKEKEDAIFEKAREEARAKLADSLPTPISPDGSQGRGPTAIVTQKQKQDIASLRGADYRKYRDQLMAEAKQKAGLV